MNIYAIDIGGSSIKHALVNPTHRESPIISLFDAIPLPSYSFDTLKSLVLAAIGRTLTAFPDIKTVAISTPGSVDDSTGIVLSGGRFEGYAGISWRAIVGAAFPQITQVFTVNDGKASAWAEFAHYEQDVKFFVHVVIGTGIGGSIISDKRFVMGDGGFAGYLGHIKITDTPTIECGCGAYCCLETLASAPAICYHYRQLRALAGESASESLTFPAIVSAISQGDIYARAASTIAAQYLGKGLAVIMNILNPGIISLGGGVIAAFQVAELPFFLETVKESAMEHAISRVCPAVRITIAHHGNDAGMIGAAQLAALGKLPI